MDDGHIVMGKALADIVSWVKKGKNKEKQPLTLTLLVLHAQYIAAPTRSCFALLTWISPRLTNRSAAKCFGADHPGQLTAAHGIGDLSEAWSSPVICYTYKKKTSYIQICKHVIALFQWDVLVIMCIGLSIAIKCAFFLPKFNIF